VLMGEQTWPSEREMAGNGSGPGHGDDGAGRNRRKVPLQVCMRVVAAAWCSGYF